MASRFHIRKIPSEYLNNSNLLMSKMDQLDKRAVSAVLDSLTYFYCQYSYLNIFLKRWISWGIPRTLKRAWPDAYCVCVNVASRSHAEKIPSEYLNNRNLLMAKMDQLERGLFLQF